MAIWTEAVLDDLFSGDRIAVRDVNDCIYVGAFRGFICFGGFRGISLEVPLDEMPEGSIGEMMTTLCEIETSAIRKISKCRCEGR